MKTIQPFIDLGWHTVPLRGKLERNEDGKKTIPQFEDNWRSKYQETVNTTATPLGGVITGAVSGIVAIDCDNASVWQIFRALDPDYSCVFISQGKKDKEGSVQECGTILYKHNEELPESFGVNNGNFALDYYSDRGFVYLPTEANKSKVAWTEVQEVKEVPFAVASLLKQLALVKDGAVTNETKLHSNVITANCLNPLVKAFTETSKPMPGLFKIITPKDFRDLPAYIANGYMLPSDVPEGRGSEYLTKISAILGADVSISQELYVDAMHKINSLFNQPMDKNRLDSTVINPMVEGRSKVGNKVLWQYQEDWSAYRLVLTSKRQSSLELCFDDNRNTYYCVDASNESVRSFGRDTELMAFIGAAAVQAPKKIEVIRSMPIVNVQSAPNLPFGFNAGDDPTARMLNTFKRTPELTVLTEPTVYASLYKRPTTTLKFLETLVPEKEMHDFLLGFVKRKLQTFKYSPVVLYFLGAHGSGKDTFVAILEKMLGHVARPTTREFLEMFNGWMVDSYFAQLDEYGNQLTKMADREEALGKLKAYSGKQNIQVRQMRTDGFMYMHNLTFIMTANKNPLMLEDGDRRVALMPTPNVLAEQDWVIKAGGVGVVYERIMNETKDFAYYLATEVPNLSDSLYMKPPESASKRRVIADSMYAAQRLAYCIKHGMKEYLLELCEDYSCSETAKGVERGHLNTINIEPLYQSMTDFNGDMRSLNKIIRSMGVELIATTQEGQKAYMYKLPWTDKVEERWED